MLYVEIAYVTSPLELTIKVKSTSPTHFIRNRAVLGNIKLQKEHHQTILEFFKLKSPKALKIYSVLEKESSGATLTLQVSSSYRRWPKKQKQNILQPNHTLVLCWVEEKKKSFPIPHLLMVLTWTMATKHTNHALKAFQFWGTLLCHLDFKNFLHIGRSGACLHQVILFSPLFLRVIFNI